MNYKNIQNLNEIKKFYKKRVLKVTPIDRKSFTSEFKEWINDSFDGNEDVWTLPDLTRLERYENFCRSIHKKYL